MTMSLSPINRNEVMFPFQLPLSYPLMEMNLLKPVRVGFLIDFEIESLQVIGKRAHTLEPHSLR